MAIKLILEAPRGAGKTTLAMKLHLALLALGYAVRGTTSDNITRPPVPSVSDGPVIQVDIVEIDTIADQTGVK